MVRSPHKNYFTTISWSVETEKKKKEQEKEKTERMGNSIWRLSFGLIQTRTNIIVLTSWWYMSLASSVMALSASWMSLRVVWVISEHFRPLNLLWRLEETTTQVLEMPVVVNSSLFRTTEKFFLTTDTFSTSTWCIRVIESQLKGAKKDRPTLQDVRFSKVPVIKREWTVHSPRR